MRALRTFTLHDLEAITGTSAHTIRKYASLLKATGYLRATATKTHRGPRKTYTLTKDTGTRAPVMRLCLYDPNIKELINAGLKS